ncbi:hypothetical protein LF1_43410 [Rubripirellula obstinata]|uniref:Uncharacterized protein n=1 Tax=Rubripirellula obstinata TaxID=406547 RepID=A0A5B1CNB0_9BACT|nr:hypothetical protein LF1_43410 [Rubripirellula obstinata]
MGCESLGGAGALATAALGGASLGGASAILRIVHLDRKAWHLSPAAFLSGQSGKTLNFSALKTAGESTDRLRYW